MSDEDIGAFYANLIYQRVDGPASTTKQTLQIPDFKTISISRSGHVTIKFTQNLLSKEIAAIDKSALDVRLLSRTDVPEGKKAFTWETTEFTENLLRLKLTFEKPLLISSETASNLDQLAVTIKNPFLYRATEGLQMVPRGTQIEGPIPPQVPDGSQESLETAAITV
jgi:hypothetical protein